eukprot:3322927-Ditylum_brightwellii.AAC.1
MATVISNRECYNLQCKIAKKETSSTSETKPGDKGNTSEKGGRIVNKSSNPTRKRFSRKSAKASTLHKEENNGRNK